MFNLVSKKYQHYRFLQQKTFASMESTNYPWAAGQRRCLDIFFTEQNRNLKILDIACGDGVGLQHFRSLGFKNVAGVEFNQDKINYAQKIGYPIYKLDMHNLRSLKPKSFDIIYSSHTLEHALDPVTAIKEIRSVLKDDGILIVILPYPDLRIESGEAHVGRRMLGTDKFDNGKGVINTFKKLGLINIDKYFDTFREPEIWLVFKKQNSKKSITYVPIAEKILDNKYVKPFYLAYSYLRRFPFFA